MSNSTPNRNRWMVPAPKPAFRQATEFLQRGDVWARVGVGATTALLLWVVMYGWSPPFSYRVREAPLRNLHARTVFEFKDFERTDDLRDEARRNFLCLYAHDQLTIEQMRQSLIDDVFEVKQKSFDEISDPGVWSKFVSDNALGKAEGVSSQDWYTRFAKALERDETLEGLKRALDKAFINIDKFGLLNTLEHKVGDGSMEEIEVYPKGAIQNRRRVKVADVRKAEVLDQLDERLLTEIRSEAELIDDPDFVAARIADWIKPQLPTTLEFNSTDSKRGADEAESRVEFAMRSYQPGERLEQMRVDLDRRGIEANVPLDDDDIELLRAEHEAFVASRSTFARVTRSILFLGMFAALFGLVTQYLYHRDHHLLADLKLYVILHGLIAATLIFAWVAAINVHWRAEIIPVTLFAMTIAIAYHIELALILGTVVALAFTVTHGYDLGEFVTLTAASSSSALLCRTIRSRTKLVSVGLISATIVFPTVIGVQYMLGQPLTLALLTNALWFAGGAAFAGGVMTALLPFLERLFDFQTDISLLELTDANHPLLKELVQRAPGTYNHSINVASMSESAADAIGANGLLCRVAAYFHDVGKLRKPEYFIENQDSGVNKHDDLVPTMSTLVIIAHVKDGAEIARKHRLPKRVIDLIEQHHGTTLVEYFYRRAAEQAECEAAENAAPLDEADFRYPGPRPQTPEAAVMMLADAVESASRTLREPTPSRIENLVESIASKKFDDGQFDECAITIEQLRSIQDSLTKSLNAMYHARVKYPEQQSA
jgi:putative nucleotidyltransferase with HDIG domain